ncbi:MAG: hypothetical protein N2515_02680 [Deltaproteobacteria bacterium]|nr:hypothetical protein [Deltaproteobacteria bacterium]
MRIPRWWIWTCGALWLLIAEGVVRGQVRELASPWGQEKPKEPMHGEKEELTIPPPPPGYSLGSREASGIRRPSLFGSDVPIRATIATRLRALDSDFQVLAARGGSSVVDGILAIVTGAATIGIGILMDTTGGLAAPGITSYLYVYGGIGIQRGILGFVFSRNPSSAAITYAHMPMSNLAEVHAKLRYGESELESLARNAEISRILDGVLSIGSGLAVIPLYLGPRNFTFTAPFDYFILVGAVISATTGMVVLFGTHEAERRWVAYRELRDRLRSTEQGAADEAELERAAREAARTTKQSSLYELRWGWADGPWVGVGYWL